MVKRRCIAKSPSFQRKVLRNTLEILDIVEAPKPKGIFIIGSYAKCTHTPTSDIDVYLQYPKMGKGDRLIISESIRDYMEEMAFEPSGGAVDSQWVGTKKPEKPFIKIL